MPRLGEKKPALEGTVAGHQEVKLLDQRRFLGAGLLHGPGLVGVALPILGVSDGSVEVQPLPIQGVQLILELCLIRDHVAVAFLE